MAFSSSFPFLLLLHLMKLLMITITLLLLFSSSSSSSSYSSSSSSSAAAAAAVSGVGLPFLSRRFQSIFSFGDSLTDTGNMKYINNRINIARLPYGETYFHRPSGRASDGRLVVDFIAKAFGIPMLPPYLGHKKEDFKHGVNFAVAGATALNGSFFDERKIPNNNYSLGGQLQWFQELLPSLCISSSDCKVLFERSLFLLGAIGGNDYNSPFVDGRSLEEIRTFVPKVIDAISSSIETLIGHGAVTFLVPGSLPNGCASVYLTLFQSPNKDDYDPFSGCLTWINEFSQYHNQLLQKELDRLRVLHPHATIFYADYYNAAMYLYLSPKELGFSKGALIACCGGGGPYNYNRSVECGSEGSSVCNDPSLYVGWDGFHLTEAAYKWVTKLLLQGPFLMPQINLLDVML